MVGLTTGLLVGVACRFLACLWWGGENLPVVADRACVASM